MKKVSAFLVLILVSLVMRGQNGSTSEMVVWYQYGENIKLSEKWKASVAIQYRDFVDRDQDYHLFLAAGLTRELANGFSLSAGIINLNINQFVSTNYLLIPELRPYQQIGYGIKHEKFGFKWRLMVEERFFRKAADGELVAGHTFNYRLRNLAQVEIPVAKKLDLSFGTEIFFNAGGVANLNAFDQNRTTVLISYKTGKTKLTTGYMHWGVLTGGDVFQNRHTWQIMASHTLDFSD